MDMLTTHLPALLLAFVVGLIVGAGLLYWLLPSRRQSSAVVRERDHARHDLDQYREQVDNHFVKTAELVNEMTRTYRAVHEHLSEGAHELCSERGREHTAARNLGAGSGSEPPSAPLDYAPSTKGTLSENFGLQQQAGEPTSPADAGAGNGRPAAEAVEPPRDYASAGTETEPAERKAQE